ncbi:MAG TPA: Stk1 family PASTA domain-containing Ser/Thr kinase [Acidimicrobiales bacterium]|nr:Stk1 family PASTA domain-containing Ser/Thr kinase [Acidimicrobiales bacterium]
MEPSHTPRVLSGRYELSHLVARGGMAEVYRAHDRLLDRPVALKVLFPELSVDRAFVERFRREAQAAANLSHPNIVPVFDWGEDGGTYFIVMEFIDGRALSSILRTAGPMHPDRAAEIGADVAIALAYAHRHGVIHRDVKPGNVLITEEGTVKVTDFGIARAVNTEESLTQTGAVMGTATYFSPEQAEGMGVDARSDIYSLGVVLFEMVTGRPPFMGDTPVAVASKHVRENPPTPREINPSVPPDLEAIILKCLAKSPEYRYATGDDLRVDLLRFREGRAVGAVAPPMMAQPTMGTTQAVPYSGTQVMGAVAEPDAEEPERSRTRLYAGILVVLLAALAVVIVFLGQSLGWWHLGSGGNTVTMPDVAGQTVTAAEHTLHNEGLRTTVLSDKGSSVPNTQVIRTVPGHGSQVQKGKLVTIVTGGKGNTIPVPADLVGQSVGSASNEVKTLGLLVKVKPSSLCAQQNIVCSTVPTAGTQLLPGKTVTLFTAPTVTTTSAPPSATVPGVAGDTETQACNAIVGNGFVCGTTSTVASNLAVNTVVSTSPPAGSSQPKGTTIDLVLSSGPANVVVQSVVGDTQAQAEAALQAQNLTVVVDCTGPTPPTTAVPVSGTVWAQNPPGGQSVAVPSSVTISVVPDASGSCPGP